MGKYSNKTVTVIDNGLFVELAARLARDFGTVRYWSPWQSAFPRGNETDVGAGLEGVERIKSPDAVEEDTDLWVFPDVYHGERQVRLRNGGHRVWGCGLAEVLELDRLYGRERAASAGLGVPETDSGHGIDALRKYCKRTENRWIKTPGEARGEGETWHHETYDLSECKLDQLALDWGINRDTREWTAEEDIKPAREFGYDGAVVDGQYHDQALYGPEVKGVGYAGRIVPYAKLPKPLAKINTALSPIFAEYGARGWWSSEARITPARTMYLTDPCLRLGNPPNQVSIECWQNLAEMLWEGAGGNVVSLEPVDEYWYILMLESEFANDHIMPLLIPKHARQWVKLRYAAKVDGRLCVIPQHAKVPMLGGVVGHGGSLQAAFDMAKEIAESVRGFQLIRHDAAYEDATQAIEEGKQYGIDF
jgi:hypothetical protein